ncbi:TetR/AcrR family transcriptional regulator [Acidiphilium sp. PA]|uniref:TetR/AcrR family transcriptional regulator n=1 Tax=Acidiphilium sp. PA TaxID=2871705 RepID=UPI002243AA81|nr:TetR/AcrR family transcriptional regulator [Acidiphilium sp. PA]MCW8309413.1 TetR/AcrR family transcriptional regulator [Acidiphilium sp. PA]
MPRPRTLTDEIVLDRAVGVFWRHGYADASLRDLTSVTGLSAASLYHRYRDKDGLFTAVLDRYAQQGLTSRLARLTAIADPLAAIRQFFDEIIDLSINDPDRLGCLLVNSVLDGGKMSQAARNTARTRLGEVETFFRIQLEKARASGTTHPGIEPAVMAEILLAAVLAIRVLARLAPERERLERLVAHALTSVSLSIPAPK